MTTPKDSKKPKKWGGRFAKEMADHLVDFNASVHFDQRLAQEDIQGSIAHCEMLATCNLLKSEEAKEIIVALGKISEEIFQGIFLFRKEDEDIHMNIERRLVEICGDLGKKIHMGRSRNDQVALDTRLYCRKAIDDCLSLLKDLQKTLINTAKNHLDFILPGYTHLQRAQPISLAHHLLAYFEMFDRDRKRFQEIRGRVNISPLGAGALAGSTLALDRKQVAKKLEFSGLCQNSLDAVSDRDYLIEFVHAASLSMMHLSRMAEEWILWSSQEFSFVEIDESLCTGSSMMPQKKNPDLPELVRGKTARVYGNLFALLSLMKGMPLAYNKDFQEDKEPFFDTYDTLAASLAIMKQIIEGSTFHQSEMLKAASEPFILATDLAEHLVKKGVPFRDAHEISGKAVRYGLDKKKGLAEFSFEEFQKISPLIKDKDILEIFDINRALDQRKTLGGTSRIRIEEALKAAKKRINE